MNITEAKYTADTITWKDGSTEKKTLGINATIDGQEMFVPVDEANTHYQEILKWVAAGNSITAAD